MPARLRSAATNRLWTLAGVDGRSSLGRRYRDLCLAFAADFGIAELSVSDRELVETAAGLALRSAQLRAKIARGESVDDDQLVRASSELRRVQLLISARAEASKPAPVPFWQRRQAADEDTDAD
jgi:hypothetical protein